MNRVLVTGATGFIGRQALAPLRDRGYQVHAATSRPSASLDAEDAVLHQADLHDPDDVARVLAEVQPSHLLHLAWYAEPGRFWTSTENLRWVESSLRLFRAFASSGGRRIAVTGTCAEYEWRDETVCSEVRTPLIPATLYGASKHGLRLIAERFAEQQGMSLAWGRVFFVFGPHESPQRLGGAISSALARGERAPCSHGEQVRDFMYTEDLADALVALLDSDVTGPVNLATGSPMRIRDLVSALADAAGRPDLVDLGALPASASEPRSLTADVTRLRTDVRWAPTVTLAARARQTIDWWRDQSARPAPSARVARS